jgi:hypothetical protein
MIHSNHPSTALLAMFLAFVTACGGESKSAGVNPGASDPAALAGNWSGVVYEGGAPRPMTVSLDKSGNITRVELDGIDAGTAEQGSVKPLGAPAQIFKFTSNDGVKGRLFLDAELRHMVLLTSTRFGLLEKGAGAPPEYLNSDVFVHDFEGYEVFFGLDGSIQELTAALLSTALDGSFLIEDGLGNQYRDTKELEGPSIEGLWFAEYQHSKNSLDAGSFELLASPDKQFVACLAVAADSAAGFSTRLFVLNRSATK